MPTAAQVLALCVAVLCVAMQEAHGEAVSVSFPESDRVVIESAQSDSVFTLWTLDSPPGVALEMRMQRFNGSLTDPSIEMTWRVQKFCEYTDERKDGHVINVDPCDTTWALATTTWDAPVLTQVPGGSRIVKAASSGLFAMHMYAAESQLTTPYGRTVVGGELAIEWHLDFLDRDFVKASTSLTMIGQLIAPDGVEWWNPIHNLGAGSVGLAPAVAADPEVALVKYESKFYRKTDQKTSSRSYVTFNARPEVGLDPYPLTPPDETTAYPYIVSFPYYFRLGCVWVPVMSMEAWHPVHSMEQAPKSDDSNWATDNAVLLGVLIGCVVTVVLTVYMCVWCYRNRDEDDNIFASAIHKMAHMELTDFSLARRRRVDVWGDDDD